MKFNYWQELTLLSIKNEDIKYYCNMYIIYIIFIANIIYGLPLLYYLSTIMCKNNFITERK